MHLDVFLYTDPVRYRAADAEKEKVVTVTVSSRHMDVSSALRAYAEQKAGKLQKYFDRIQEVEVVFDNLKDRVNVEMIVNAEHARQFVASSSETDAYACVDSCVDKLERQLHEHKDKHRNRKHLAGEDKHVRG